jgi:ribosome-associated protein
MREFILTSEYIELIKLLKLLQISETGGHAKIMVEEGVVFLNGKKEFRKRAKLKTGDKVEVFGEEILVKS